MTWSMKSRNPRLTFISCRHIYTYEKYTIYNFFNFVGFVRSSYLCRNAYFFLGTYLGSLHLEKVGEQRGVANDLVEKVRTFHLIIAVNPLKEDNSQYLTPAQLINMV